MSRGRRNHAATSARFHRRTTGHHGKIFHTGFRQWSRISNLETASGSHPSTPFAEKVDSIFNREKINGPKLNFTHALLTALHEECKYTADLRVLSPWFYVFVEKLLDMMMVNYNLVKVDMSDWKTLAKKNYLQLLLTVFSRVESASRSVYFQQIADDMTVAFTTTTTTTTK